MYLKNRNLIYISFIIFFFLQKVCFGYVDEPKKIISYLEDLRFFSASFIQNDYKNISEGKIFIGSERIRVEYEEPTKILIILDKDKAMYYNYDLDEDEFFDPKNTQAWFFFDIFNNPDFFLDSKIIYKDNNISLEKSGYNNFGEYTIKVIFEDNPLIIRKIELLNDETHLTLSIYDHKRNLNFDERFFKLINPSFFN